MDNRIPPSRADVVTVPTTPRPTSTPLRVRFSDVLAGGAAALVHGAEAVASTLPGAPLAAVAVRGGASMGTSATPSSTLGSAPSFASSVSVTPEGPGGATTGVGLMSLGSAATGGTTASGASGTSDASIESSMAQSEQMNLYYLQIQEQVNAQNRTFTALSNVLEVEHSTAKSAIGNIH
jgi:hypothetical protein